MAKSMLAKMVGAVTPAPVFNDPPLTVEIAHCPTIGIYEKVAVHEGKWNHSIATALGFEPAKAKLLADPEVELLLRSRRLLLEVDRALDGLAAEDAASDERLYAVRAAASTEAYRAAVKTCAHERQSRATHKATLEKERAAIASDVGASLDRVLPLAGRVAVEVLQEVGARLVQEAEEKWQALQSIPYGQSGSMFRAWRQANMDRISLSRSYEPFTPGPVEKLTRALESWLRELT